MSDSAYRSVVALGYGLGKTAPDVLRHVRLSARQWGGGDKPAVRGDLLAALVVALLSLPMTIPLGVMALAPLGPDYMVTGVLAGFYASAFAGFVSALTGGSRFQISGPRASVSLILASAIGAALNDPHVVELGLGRQDGALLIGFLVTLLAGMVQVGFGLARIGRVIRYIPYPVLSGFMNGVAVVIVLGQLPAALGLPVGHGAGADWLTQASPLAMAVALVTILAVWATPRLKVPLLPPIVFALIVGLSAYWLFTTAFGISAGPLVGPVKAAFPHPDAFALLSLVPREALLGALSKQLPLVMILALVGSLESLLSAAVLDRLTGTHHDSNRELIGQGLGNMIGACFGGVPSTGAPMRGIASIKVGGRTRMAGALHSVLLLALLLWGAPALGFLPYSVMAGIMIMVAVAMFDPWPLVLLRRGGLQFFGDFLVVTAVAGVTVMVGLAMGVAVGIGFAILQFVVGMSRPIVRGVFDRSQIKSRRVRPLAVEEVLQHDGRLIAVVELEGPLFFGTGEAVREALDCLAADKPKTIILDMRRTSHIDLSGARVLQQIGQTQAKLGCRMILSGIEDNSHRSQWLATTGVDAAIPASQWFPSLDHAMEAAEDLVIGDRCPGEEGEVPVEDLNIVRGVTGTDMEVFKKLLVRRRYYGGDLIFRKGEACDGLYLLVSGIAEIRLSGPDRPAMRLASFTPGTILGELALLDGGDRSADAVAVEDAVLYHMSMEAFEKFRTKRPRAATQLLINIGRELADRLRLTNARLFRAE